MIRRWDTLAIGKYLNEIEPAALLLPADRAKRTLCRSISAEMHSGFGPMRSALPMNLKGDFPNFKVWTQAQADIDRITGFWRECHDRYGGPFLLGERSMADAMYAPVATRFLTYHVKLDEICAAYMCLRGPRWIFRAHDGTRARRRPAVVRVPSRRV